MKQRNRFTIFAIACAVLLAGCGFRDKNDIKTVEEAVGGVIDAGAVDLPNRPGYKLRSYVVLRPKMGQHFVYVIEKDGTPVAGAQTTTSTGQHQDTVSSDVANTDSPSPAAPVAGVIPLDQAPGKP